MGIACLKSDQIWGSGRPPRNRFRSCLCKRHPSLLGRSECVTQERNREHLLGLMAVSSRCVNSSESAKTQRRDQYQVKGTAVPLFGAAACKVIEAYVSANIYASASQLVNKLAWSTAG